MSSSLPASVLVVRLGALGDVVNALVFATALKEHDPAVRIGWAVHDLALPLVEGHPCVDRVHLWRRGSGAAGWCALLTEIRAARYALAVDLQRIAKSAFVARLSGAPRVLGFDRRRAKEWSWLWSTERIAPGPRSEHMVEQYLSFARHLGVPDPRPRHVFPRDDAAEAFAAALVAELGGAPVLVNLGASKPAKLWAPARFGTLAARLAESSGAPVCLIGGPGDRERARIAITAAGRGPRVRDLAGRTSLRELVALCARARLYVGGDSGPMHVAAAHGVRCVVLFGPGDPARTGPWGAGHRILRAAPRAGEREPRVDDLELETVLAATEELLVP